MKAIILAAGQGSRLLPLTNDQPKCLLPLGDTSVLQLQIEMLDRMSDIDEIVVVTGFMAEKVERAVGEISGISTPVRLIFNPFYNLADNLASCWMARDAMCGDFLIVNGDSLFEMAVLPHLFENAHAPINLTVNTKSDYDSDDMKVSLDGERATAVGKTIPLRQTDAESIGLVLFRQNGGVLFRAEMDKCMRDGSGLKAWYLQVINELAQRTAVGVVDIGDLEWGEIDFPSDLDEAIRLVSGWQRPRALAC